MLEHLKELLCDELHGAKEYAKSAIEAKTSHANWAKMYMDMSMAELNHANNIYKMSEEHYRNSVSAYTTPPKYMEDLWHEIVDIYTTKSAKVKYIQEMYNA